jgi:hypothetical protein
MGKLRTSANSYWRGVPNNANYFGYLVQGNYQIVQPQITPYYGFLRNTNIYNYNIHGKNKS